MLYANFTHFVHGIKENVRSDGSDLELHFDLAESCHNYMKKYV